MLNQKPANENMATKEVYVDYEEKMSLEGAATFLETIVTKLKQQQLFTLTIGGQSYEVKPANQVGLEVKYEKEKDGKYKFELELEWRQGGGEGIQVG